MRSIAFGSLALAVVTSFVSCKTTNNPESALADSSKVQEIGDEIFACYNVMKVESSSSIALVTKLKEKSKALCIRKKPLNLVITDSASEDLLSWQFSEIEALRCPGCFRLKGANGEAVATITRTAATLVYNMSLDSKGLGGTVRLMLQQVVVRIPTQEGSIPKFHRMACGTNESRNVVVEVSEGANTAFIKVSGGSNAKEVTIPAEMFRKVDELVFASTDQSGALLRIVSKSGRFYGVFRDSRLNDEVDLGPCVVDPKDEPLY